LYHFKITQDYAFKMLYGMITESGLTTDKTILVLAASAAFIGGAAVFGLISEYQVEAAPTTDPLDPILKPMNFTINKLDIYHGDIDKIDERISRIAGGIGSTQITEEQADELLAVLEDIELTAIHIQETTTDASDVINDGPICGDGVVEFPEECEPPDNPVACTATCEIIIID